MSRRLLGAEDGDAPAMRDVGAGPSSWDLRVQALLRIAPEEWARRHRASVEANERVKARAVVKVPPGGV